MPSADNDEVESDDLGIAADMLGEAIRYICSFSWVNSVEYSVVEFAVPEVIAVVKVFIVPSEAGIDTELWVVVGDLPSAYFVTDQAGNAGEAMKVYCDLMDDWAQTVISHGDLTNVFPVEANATEENAIALQDRIDLIRTQVIPLSQSKT